MVSGMVCDKYEEVLVLQTSALGMDQRKAEITSGLQKLFQPRAIVERNDMASRKFEGLAESNSVLMGTLDGEVDVKLNGLSFKTNLLTGHKTGLYLDQQQNYELVGKLARGAQVLDCFCFLGGFSVHAARGGATHVHGL